MRKLAALLVLAALALFMVAAQDRTTIIVSKEAGKLPQLAVPDFRGSGDAQKLMAPFNETLWNDLKSSGFFDLVPKSMMPAFIPQQPSDFQTPPPPGGRNQPQSG